MNHPLPTLPPNLAALARSFVRLGREADEQSFTGWMSSGVCIAPGYLLTAGHAVKGGGPIIVHACHFDRRRWSWRLTSAGEAVIMKIDDDLDLALLGLRTPVPPLRPAKLSENKGPPVGKPVWRLGNDAARVAGGYIFCSEYYASQPSCWASMPTKPGASGGPLFSAEEGCLVGVVTSYQPNQQYPQAAGAVPQHVLRSFLADVPQLR